MNFSIVLAILMFLTPPAQAYQRLLWSWEPQPRHHRPHPPVADDKAAGNADCVKIKEAIGILSKPNRDAALKGLTAAQRGVVARCMGWPTDEP